MRGDALGLLGQFTWSPMLGDDLLLVAHCTGAGAGGDDGVWQARKLTWLRVILAASSSPVLAVLCPQLHLAFRKTTSWPGARAAMGGLGT